MFHVLCGVTYHIKKMTSCLPGEIFFFSNTKKKHWPRQQYRGEDGHYFSFQKGDVTWILKREDLNLEKVSYIGCEGALFIWVYSTPLLHYMRKVVGFEIT